MVAPRDNILGLTLHELSDFAERIGEKRYRGKQLFDWLYTKDVRDFAGMSSLAKNFRAQLVRLAQVVGVEIADRQRSPTDGTTKFLIRLHDGLHVETVLIPPRLAFRDAGAEHEEEQRRLTLCISSQAGCPLDCTFCATASMGFLRNLSTGEIIDQVMQIRRVSERPVTNIVFMGMGEPMMNYTCVMNAVEILINGMNFPAKRITISTAGWADNIRQMADDGIKAKLAISLHSAVNETRTMLMPINKKYPLDVLMSAIEYYHRKTKKRVTYEYIFFDGVNDSDREVAQLITLAHRVPCKINIIPYHDIASAGTRAFSANLRPSPRMHQLADHLRERNLSVFVRSSAGEDIDAACGQLAVKTEKEEARRARLMQRHGKEDHQGAWRRKPPGRQEMGRNREDQQDVKTPRV